MRDTREGATESYKWTAFMKLKGQTWARRGEEILDEFDGFVESLRSVGVDYNVIVMVEGRPPRRLYSEYQTREMEPGIPREESGA